MLQNEVQSPDAINDVSDSLTFLLSFMEAPMTKHQSNEESLHRADDVQQDSPEIDLVGAIMDYESGDMDPADIIPFFQHLLDTGIIYHLQGSYQRTASELIDSGAIVVPACEHCEHHEHANDQNPNESGE